MKEEKGEYAYGAFLPYYTTQIVTGSKYSFIDLPFGLQNQYQKMIGEEDPERIQYYKDHKCCPLCSNEEIERTCMGFIIGDKDINRASCRCGWKGIVNDLVPVKE